MEYLKDILASIHNWDMGEVLWVIPLWGRTRAVFLELFFLHFPIFSFLYSRVLLLVNGLRVDILLKGLIAGHDCLMLTALHMAGVGYILTTDHMLWGSSI